MEESVRMEPVSQGRSWLAGLFLFTICLFALENSLALAVLDLPSWLRTQRSVCVCIPSAGINGVHHHHPASLFSL